MRGYSYDRRDVTGRGLANAYAQTLGTIFSSGGEKPYEVELFVAEIGDAAADDQIYRLTYDGQVADEHGYAVMGGAADVVATYLAEHYAEGTSLEDAVRLAVAALGHDRGRRPGDPRQGPRGRGARPHPPPAPQVPSDHAGADCVSSWASAARPSTTPSRRVDHSGAAQAAPPGAEGPPSSRGLPTRSPGPTPATEPSPDDEPPIAPPA